MKKSNKRTNQSQQVFLVTLRWIMEQPSSTLLVKGYNATKKPDTTEVNVSIMIAVCVNFLKNAAFLASKERRNKSTKLQRLYQIHTQRQTASSPRVFRQPHVKCSPSQFSASQLCYTVLIQRRDKTHFVWRCCAHVDKNKQKHVTQMTVLNHRHLTQASIINNFIYLV